MTEASFDPTGAVRFDLPHGAIHTAEGEAALLVPRAALDALARTASTEVNQAFGLAIGASVGAQVRASLALPNLAPLEVFATHFAGALALAGCGAAKIERWGRAMVVSFTPPSLPSVILSATLRSTLQTATGRSLDTVLLIHTTEVSRHLIVNEKTAAEARAWMHEGASWGDVLTRLEERTTSAGGATR